MKILAPDEFLPESIKPALTLGTFDGVHLGHKHIFSEMQKTKRKTLIILFKTPPSNFLQEKKVPLLTTLEKKQLLFEEFGIDYLYMLEPKKELFEKTYEEFLSFLHKKFFFSELFLGKNAVFGKGREGKEERVKEAAKKWGFRANYLSLLESISSSEIRRMILEGDLQRAEKYLGRPHTLTFKIFAEKEKTELALPPNGKYPVLLKTKKGTIFPSVAQIDQDARLIQMNDKILNDVEISFNSSPLSL